MTDFISEFHEGKMTLAEAFAGAWEKRYCAPIECAEEREYRAEQLEELRKCAAIRYMFAHGYKYVLHEDGSKSWRKARKQDMQNKIDLVCAQCGRVIEAAIPGYYGEEYCSVNGENVHFSFRSFFTDSMYFPEIVKYRCRKRIAFTVQSLLKCFV